MSSALARVLTEKHIRELAGQKFFERGQAYHAGGHVEDIVSHRDTLTARVTGTDTYAVRLSAENGSLAHSCTCPVGRDGGFCKHCVAVALAWIEAAPHMTGGAPSREPRRRAAADTPLIRLDDLHPWLLQQTPATLADLLLDTAARDIHLREKLLRQAARATAKGIDLSAYRKSIDRATRTRGFIDYHEASGFARGIDEAVAPLRELLDEDPAHAAAVIDLAEHALARVEKALGEADDSNGEISSVLAGLQDLHLDACAAARPDPEALAARLFAWELRTGWNTFYNAVTTYADILGSAGLATYRRLAETEWAKLPGLRPGEPETYNGKRFRLTSIMEALARAGGDLEALVAIKAKDLSHAYDFLSIAQLYHDAKQPDAALDWAERGLKAFPKDTDQRLLEFLADAYHRRQRHDDALALIWRPFESRPALESYQRLKQHADRASAWPAWRERALAHLRARTARTEPPRKKTAPPDVYWTATLSSTLVRIHLWEKDPEAAWLAAQQQRMDRNLWLELAASREKTHPADAIPIYLREAEALIAQTGRPSYEAAVVHLKKVKTLSLRLGQSAEWTALLARLRTTHKAKRTLLPLLAGL